MSAIRVRVTRGDETVIDETTPYDVSSIRFVEKRFDVTIEPDGATTTVGVRFDFDPPGVAAGGRGGDVRRVLVCAVGLFAGAVLWLDARLDPELRPWLWEPDRRWP